METMKVLLHSIVDHFRAKTVEILGYSVSGTLFIISQMPVLDIIERGLQIAVLLVSLAGGIATYFYVRKKTKKLDQ